MNPAQRQAVINLALKRISEEEFLSCFPSNPRLEPEYMKESLERALHEKNSADVEAAMLLGFTLKLFRAADANVLCRLLREDWHEQHEDIASVLQKLKDPATVECLHYAATKQFAYLAYDDAHALAVKCLWALSAINTPAARAKLDLLAKSPIQIVRENAMRLLERAEKLA